MSQAPVGQDGPTVRRILVGIDASPSSLAALETALNLAVEQNAQVEGLYIEDLNLVRLAQLPFAREVVHVTAQVRTFALKDLERQLRAQADRARGAIAEQAGRRGVRWRFEVARGDIARELLRRADEADLVILGRSGWSGSHALGSTAQAALLMGQRPTMLLQFDARLNRSVGVVTDGSEFGQRALQAAADLAQRHERGLRVFVLAPDPASAEELRAELAAAMQARQLAATFETLPAEGWQRQLRRAVADRDCLLVLPVRLTGVAPEALLELANRLSCPLFIVR